MSGHTKTELRRGRLPVRQTPATTQDEQNLLLNVEGSVPDEENQLPRKPGSARVPRAGFGVPPKRTS